VTLTVAGPIVAVLEAVSVSVLLVPVAGFGLKLAVTPAGNPVALKVTLPVKPPICLIEIALVPLALRLIARLAGLAVIAKSGVGTIRLIVAVRVRPPPVPVTVTVAEPRAAALDAVRVSVLLPPVVEEGLKLAVTPLGNPLALKATLSVMPARLIVIALVTLGPPRLIVRLGGLAESVKLGAATVMANVVERVRPPPTPVMVTVAAPRAAVLDAVRVSVLLPPVVEAGLKLAVTPLGNPLTLKATLLVKLVRLIVIVLAPLAP
jgi:hypothetical protein